MDINISSQIVVQTSAQWAADNTVYSAKRILVTSDANWDNTDQRKFKIADGTQTWSQLDYPPIGYETMTTSAGEFKFAKTTAGAVLLWTNGQDMRFSASVGGSPAFILKTDGTIVLENGTANKFLKTGASKEITFVDNLVDVNTIGSAINGANSATPNDTDLVMSVDSSVAKKNTWTQVKAFLKTYFDTVYKATFTENTAFNKDFGTGTTNIVEIGSTLGNSLIISTNANGKLQTLSNSTYPSLTELSYVKGLTSAVQTQLNSKGYTLIGGTSATSPADSTTYFFGGVQSQGLLSSENVTTKMPIPKTGTIKSVQLSFINSGATTESSTMLLRLNATTDYTISTTTDMSSSLVANYALSIPVTQGDTFCFKWTTPAWVTNPANLRFHIVVYIE